MAAGIPDCRDDRNEGDERYLALGKGLESTEWGEDSFVLVHGIRDSFELLIIGNVYYDTTK